MALERAATQNYRLGTSLLTYGKVVTPESVYDRLAKVTSAEIQQVARKILTMRTLSLAMVGSGPSKEEILDLVEKGG